MWGWGAMNPTAVKEAAKINFPMDKFVGVWWSGGEDDARPTGAGGERLSPRSTSARSAPTSRRSRTSVKHVVDKGKSQSQKDKVGETHYNKGVYNSVLIAEAIRNAQKITGKKVVTGEDVRRGLETLNISAARWKETRSCRNSARRSAVSCTDHNGHQAAYMQQWDGTKWVKITDWIAPMKEQGASAAGSGGQGLCQQEPALAEAHGALRQVVVRLAQPPLPLRERGRAAARGEG